MVSNSFLINNLYYTISGTGLMISIDKPLTQEAYR